MKHSHPRHKSSDNPFESTGEDDGIDPKYDRSPSSTVRKGLDRKAAQLCAQIRRSLEYIIPEALADTRWDALVLEVEPSPNTSHLVIHLQALQTLESAELRLLEQAVLDRMGMIRSSVAQSICRKRAPTLSFRILPCLEPPITE